MSEDTPSFFDRWSRLKRRVSLEREAPRLAATPAPPHDGTPRPAGPPVEPVRAAAETSSPPPAPSKADDDAPLDLSKLPSIESLGRDSDYTMFMRKGVPEDVRLRALRRMWLTDPSISGPDLLEMNALDYTGLDGPQPLIKPAVEAVAAVAKAARKAIAEAEARPEPAIDQPPAAASRQEAPESASIDDTSPKTG